MSDKFFKKKDNSNKCFLIGNANPKWNMVYSENNKKIIKKDGLFKKFINFIFKVFIDI